MKKSELPTTQPHENSSLPNFLSGDIPGELKNGITLSQDIISLINQFLDLIEQRGNTMTEKLKTSIVKGIRSKTEYKTETELKQYLRSLITLASKHTPQGKYFLSQEFIRKLADYKNWEKNGITPEKQPQINLILKAVEKGFLPSTVINSFLFNCNEINPLILQDIKIRISKDQEKIKESDFIKTYPSHREFLSKNIILPSGTFFKFKKALNPNYNDKIWIAGENDRRHGPLNISGETLCKILPLVGRYYIEQGKSGTCYQLAAYLSMMKDPHFYARILQRLEEDQKGVLCTLPMKAKGIDLLRGKTKEFNEYKQLFVRFNHNNTFDTPNRKQTVTAKPFYQALEHLYGKYRKYKRANEYIESLHLSGPALQRKINEVIQNIDQYVYEIENGKRVKYTLQQINEKQPLGKRALKGDFKCVEDYYKEGGTTLEVFDMFGGSVKQTETLSEPDITYRRVQFLLSKTQQDFVRTFGTKSTNGVTESPMDPHNGLYTNHGYSIYDYDPKTDIVKYINPRNSAYIFQMKLSDLIPHIKNLTAIKLA